MYEMIVRSAPKFSGMYSVSDVTFWNLVILPLYVRQQRATAARKGLRGTRPSRTWWDIRSRPEDSRRAPILAWGRRRPRSRSRCPLG